MVAFTGFVQRLKGKTQTDSVFIGQGGVHEYVYNTVDASLSPGAVLPNNGVSVVKASSAPQVITLGAPVNGIEKTIVVTTQSSGSIAIKTNSTATVFFDGVNAIWKPSNATGTAIGVSLVGLSTTAWQQLGVSNSTAVGVTGFVTSS